MTIAVVPAKDLCRAKTRLAALLDPVERQRLSIAMLGDVLSALASSPGVHATWVVTREPDLIALSASFGAEACIEPENAGHTEAVRFAVGRLLAKGERAMLTIPGDVPAVTAGEIEAVLAAPVDDRAAVLVPSRTGLGTNGVLLRPASAMPLVFGEPSFDNHLARARALGLPTRVLTLAGLGLDIDTPEDLIALMASRGAARTRALIAELGLARRLDSTVAHAR